MNTRHLLLAAALLALPAAPARAAFEELELGVSDLAMGGSGVLGCGAASLFANPASIAGGEGSELVAAGRVPFSRFDFTTAGLDASLPMYGAWRAGASARFFGGSDYSEKLLAFTASGMLGRGLAVGIQPVLAQVSIGDGQSSYGSAGAFSINLGFRAELYDRWAVAASIRNPFESRIGESGEHFERRLDIGVSYEPATGMQSRVAVSRDFRGLRFSMGQALPVGPLTLMAGVRTDPAVFCAGFGATVGSARLEYSIMTHPSLSPSHSAGVSYAF